MPDGDKVHGNLKLRYQNPYKALCENAGTSNERAKSLLRALKKTLKEQGNHPIRLAQAMGDCLQRTVEGSSDPSSVPWASAGQNFEELARATDGSPYAKELALRAGRVLLHAYRNGIETDVENASALIIKQYMRDTYESEFKERIPLTDKHHDGVDEATLMERVEAMEPDISNAIGKWAEKVASTGRVDDIRLPRQPKLRPVGIDEDLLCA
ncbi:MAG: hypothetical protein AAF810_02405 [Cyanobacteria bacterium P01_D01_bin.36]